jgi:hypothetical protein
METLVPAGDPAADCLTQIFANAPDIPDAAAGQTK